MERYAWKAIIKDGMKAVMAGIITGKKTLITKNNKMMAFITLEDLVGTVEVILFPRDFEAYRHYLNTDEKIFVKGRVSATEEENGKLICEKVVPFDSVPAELWIKFADKDDYLAREKELLDTVADSDGRDSLVIYCAKEKAKKILPPSYNVQVDTALVGILSAKFGADNVKVVEKSIENTAKMH